MNRPPLEIPASLNPEQMPRQFRRRMLRKAEKARAAQEKSDAQKPRRRKPASTKGNN